MLQEFRMRVRTGRWQWLLGSWTAVVWIFTGLLYLALRRAGRRCGRRPAVRRSDALRARAGAHRVPRDHRAVHQRRPGTRHARHAAGDPATPTDIVVGKLLAGWSVGLVALTLTLPAVAWSVVEGVDGVSGPSWCCSWWRCSSAWCAPCRWASRRWCPAASPRRCCPTSWCSRWPPERRSRSACPPWWSRRRADRAATDLVWWMLAPNPFVVLADAAPKLPEKIDPRTGRRVPQPARSAG